MVATVELPVPLMVLGTVTIAISIAVTILTSLMQLPTLFIIRRKSAYFDDWNSALKAPWLFWWIGGLWYRITELLGNYVLPAPQRVSDLAFAYCKSQAVISLTQLGIPDALEHGPKTSLQLATELKLHQPYLERLLRLSERIGLVEITSPKAAAASGSSGSSGGSSGSGRTSHSSSRVHINEGGQLYHLTQLSAVLCESHVNSVKHMVLLFGDHFAAFAHLSEGVRSGQTPYKLHAGGLSHWEHMRKEPQLYERFNKAMTDFNNMCPVEAVFLEYKFDQFDRLVDVGGGLGAFTAAALTREPELKGHLFDLPNVVKQAQEVWCDKYGSLLCRMSFAVGSFFEGGKVPPASSHSNVFAMRQILHDWSDTDSISILKQVRAAIGRFTGCKLLIVESCLASNSMTTTHTPRMCGDIHMLVQYGDAKERTEQQFGELLAAAGFELKRVMPTKSLFFVLEAVPV